VEETDAEIGQFHNIQTSMTLTLDQVNWHTTVCHSLTSTHIPNFAEIRKTVLWADGQKEWSTQHDLRQLWATMQSKSDAH